MEYSDTIIYISSSVLLTFGYYLNKVLSKNKELEEKQEQEYQPLMDENIKIKEMNNKLKMENESLLKNINELSLEISNKDIKLTSFSNKLEEYYNTKKVIESEEKKTEEKKPEEKEIKFKNTGIGKLRYKNKEGTIYYHGIGHLEHKYAWWRPYMNRNIIQYKNKNRKIIYPEYETHDISYFCTNCEYSEKINKTQRSLFYYECKGHKINVD